MSAPHRSMDNHYRSGKCHYPMETTIETNGHIIKGKQRIAVYNALDSPATGRKILTTAKQAAPSMTYQDLRHILRDFQNRNLITCLNPEDQPRRIYARTTETRNPISDELVSVCARIDRAKNRLAVLKEVSKERYFETEPMTATRIRKLMLESHPLGLNHVLAALQFLEHHDLVEVVDYTAKRDLKIYDVTDRGRAVVKQLCGD